jgi:hypothetical protein
VWSRQLRGGSAEARGLWNFSVSRYDMMLSNDTSCEIKLNLLFQRGNWTHVGGSEGTSLVMIEDPSIGNEAGSSSREGSSDSGQSIPEKLKSGSEGLKGG